MSRVTRNPVRRRLSVALVVLAGALSACMTGGFAATPTPAPDPRPGAVLQRAAAAITRVHAFHYSGRSEITGGQVTLLDGEVVLPNSVAGTTQAVQNGQTYAPGRVVALGGTVWLQVPGTRSWSKSAAATTVPTGKPTPVVDAGGDAFANAGVNLFHLAQWMSAVQAPVDSGETTLDGVAVRHLTGMIPGPPADAATELWIGRDDDRLRQFTMHLDLDTGKTTFDARMQLSRFDDPGIHVVAPAP